jgi:hypothetical protein
MFPPLTLLVSGVAERILSKMTLGSIEGGIFWQWPASANLHIRVL